MLLSMRLGLPVLDEEKSCSLCMQTIDVFGDHAACCSMSSDRIHRHNRVRNLLDRICQEGMLAPVMEKKRLLGDVYGRRPGDVTIPVWRANKGLAIDVAVTSPLASSISEPCESYATWKKHAYYDDDFKGTAFEFAAMVFETTGGVNIEGLEVLRQLFRSQAPRPSTECLLWSSLGAAFLQHSVLGLSMFPQSCRQRSGH